MDNKRIEELINKGFITQTLTVKDLETLSEKDLLEKGFITQTSIFDGDDNTIDEIVTDKVVEDEPKTTGSETIVEDEPKTTGSETIVEDEVVEDDVKPVVDEGDEEE